MNHEALEVLRRMGASVNERAEMVRIPEPMIREALDSARRRVVLFSRDGKKDIDLSSGRNPHLTTDGTAMHVIDLSTGTRRRGTTMDLFRFALVSDYLDEVDVFWPMVAASDVPDAEHTVHEFLTSIMGTSKHIQHEARGLEEARAELAIAGIITGGSEELRKKPIFSSVFTPVSPLAFEKESIDSMMLFVSAGVPIVALSMVQMGYTGPGTLAGSLTVANAEILASLVLAHCVTKETPFIYGIFAGPFDSSRSAFLAGSPELALMSAAGAQMATYYGLPSLASGMLTDSSAEEPVRTTLEKLQTGIIPALAGASLVSGIGGLSTDEAVSLEQLVIDCDIWSSIKRISRGIRIEPDLIGTDLIGRLGPLANYLSEIDSAKLPKEDFQLRRLLSREMGIGKLNSKGVRSIREIAHEKIREILTCHRAVLLDKESEREALRIMKEFRKSVTHRSIEQR